MVSRWLPQEEAAIAEIRRRLNHLIHDGRPQYPEVVGDRRILRFLRGKQMNVDDATALYKDFLLWRTKNKVDQIRQEIVYGGRNSPFFFPWGKEIIDLAPQIIVTPHSRDRYGRPLCLEQYCFNPKDVLKVVSREEYLHFLTYALEYRALVMEQLSHELEQEYLDAHPNDEDRVTGYGVVLLDYTIRDLKGIGFNHIGSDGRAILKAALDLGLPNYPEYLGKSHMINVPGFFSAMWYFIKQILDEPTQAKFEFSGYDYMNSLLKDISIENIPACLGGQFDLYNEPYTFDTSSTGPFYYPEAEEDRRLFEETTPYFEFDFGDGTVHGKGGKHVTFRSASMADMTEDASSPTDPDASSIAASESSAMKRKPLFNLAALFSSPSSSAAPTPINSPTGTPTPNNTSRTGGAFFFPETLVTRTTKTLDFWTGFCGFCWRERRLESIVGLCAMLSLLVFDPIALQACLLCAFITYVFFFD